LIHLKLRREPIAYITYVMTKEIGMRTQAVHSHLAIWLLLLFAAIVVGFFMTTVKPAAQAPDAPVAASQVAPDLQR